jgi:hypothetical protein
MAIGIARCPPGVNPNVAVCDPTELLQAVLECRITVTVH